MRKASSALALAAGFVICGVALAADVVGAGTWSCIAWSDARKSRRSDTTEQWALGFLSGVGFAGPHGVDPLRDLPPQAVSEWVDRYCRSHPNDTIAHAVEAFSATRQIFTGASTVDKAQ
jgi:hypothetical protein